MYRIREEYENLKKNPKLGAIGCTIGLFQESNLYKWKASYIGPKNTAYEQSFLELEINLPTNYPNSAPSVNFITKIFHPNVSFTDGRICIESINKWKPEYNILTILFSIYILLIKPNPDDPLNSNAAKIYKEDKIKFNQEVKKYIKLKFK